MPKTHNGLWPLIYDFGNLYQAFLRASKNKRYQPDVLRFAERLEENLIILQNELIWKCWEPLPARQFEIIEPKRRLIRAPAFRDRIIHHAVVGVIQPFFDRKMLANSFACRAGKGTHAAVCAARQMLRSARREHGRYAVLKADIHSYFPSIDHSVLKKILRRTIGDRDVLWLLDAIVDGGGNEGRGLDIGALTSQLFANVYLDVLDHYVTDDLGWPRYLRYMDDFVIVDGDREALRRVLGQIRDFLARRLRLSLNPKTSIFADVQGLNFCGYRIWSTHTLPRKRNVRRIHRRLRRMAKLYAKGKLPLENVRPVIASYLGYMKHCDGHETVTRFLGELVFERRSGNA